MTKSMYELLKENVGNKVIPDEKLLKDLVEAVMRENGFGREESVEIVATANVMNSNIGGSLSMLFSQVEALVETVKSVEKDMGNIGRQDMLTPYLDNLVSK